jgi:hypothetical protein
MDTAIKCGVHLHSNQTTQCAHLICIFLSCVRIYALAHTCMAILTAIVAHYNHSCSSSPLRVQLGDRIVFDCSRNIEEFRTIVRLVSFRHYCYPCMVMTDVCTLYRTISSNLEDVAVVLVHSHVDWLIWWRLCA